MKPGILPGLARRLAATASDVLGSGPLYIDGGGAVEAILGDTQRGEDYPDDVAEPESSRTAVVTAAEFLSEYTEDPGTYINKKANAGGEEFRIVSIVQNPGLFILNLKDVEEGA